MAVTSPTCLLRAGDRVRVGEPRNLKINWIIETLKTHDVHKWAWNWLMICNKSMTSEPIATLVLLHHFLYNSVHQHDWFLLSLHMQSIKILHFNTGTYFWCKFYWNYSMRFWWSLKLADCWAASRWTSNSWNKMDILKVFQGLKLNFCQLSFFISFIPITEKHRVKSKTRK